MKKTKILLGISIILLSFLISGCATIFNGSTQRITINSNVNGATVTYNGTNIGTTPFAGDIPRQAKGTLTVSHPGYQSQSVELNGSINGLFWASLLLFWPGTTTDAVTGAMYTYMPNTYFADLTHLTEQAVRQQSFDSDTALVHAVDQAVSVAFRNVLPNRRIAIVQITTTDGAMRDYVTGQIEFLAVDKGFRVVDRNSLNEIRAEQNFQLSAEVDERTAVDIGKLAGADYIVTGQIDGVGNLRRLRIRVLDTQTAELVGAAAEPF